MSLNICRYPWYHHHDQGNRHTQHLPVSWCPFVIVVYVCVCYFLVVRVLNMRSTLLTNLNIDNMVLLTTDTMLYSRPLDLVHVAELKLYTHWITPLHPPFLRLWQPLLHSPLPWIWLLQNPPLSWIMQYLSSCDWLISCSRMSSRFTHVFPNSRISFYFKAE